MDSQQKYKTLKIKWFYFGIVLTLGRVYYATIQNYYTSFMKTHFSRVLHKGAAWQHHCTALLQILSCWILLNSSLAATCYAQAQLTIENKSNYTMHIKIMRQSLSAANGATLYQEVKMLPHSTEEVLFYQTDNYYLKTKATRANEPTLYKKGHPFEVYNGTDGYSVMTITFDIRGGGGSNPLNGKSISKEEFNKN